jgi:hypothetical protein
MKRLSIFILLCALASLLVGCGGGSGSGTSTLTTSRATRVTFTFEWPAVTRLIPAAAQSIKLDIRDSSGLIASQIINRPNTSATFQNLPVGGLTVTATAFSGPNATGSALASTTVAFTLQPGVNPNITITLVTTIDHIDVAPITLAVGQSGTLVAIGRDVANNKVDLTASKVTFSSSNTNVATVASPGTASGAISGAVTAAVTAVGSGTSVITVTDTESGKTSQAVVTVSPQSSTGTADVTVTNIPSASLSIRMDISTGTQAVASVIVPRLAFTGLNDMADVSFDGQNGNPQPLPLGSYTVKVNAYPDASAGGTSQAVGTSAAGALVITRTANATLSVGLTSTIDHVEFLQPANINDPAQTSVIMGHTLQLVVVAKDKPTNGNTVIGSFSFDRGGPPSVTIDDTGLVTGVLPGSSVVQATEIYSGKISPQVTITVTPSWGSATGVIK